MVSAGSQNRFIIVTSDEPWCEVWHTQLHYAWQLSLINEVCYVQPPSGWKLRNLLLPRRDIKSISQSLRVISYINYLPASLGKWAIRINDRLNVKWLKSITTERNYSEIIFWHFDPMRGSEFTIGGTNERHIYHVVDPYAGKNLDAELAAMADLVVVTSPKFVKHYEQLNRNVIQIRQGVDYHFFKQKVKENLPAPSGKKAVLLGTLSDEVDLVGIISAMNNVNGELVIIGPDRFKTAAKRVFLSDQVVTGKVIWVGPKAPEAFIKDLMAAQVGLIFYENNSINDNNLRSPLKVISYLAVGIPVITNIDCEIPELVGKAIYFASDENEFQSYLQSALSGELMFDRTAVDEYLQQISYPVLIKNILECLDKSYATEK